MIVTADDVGLSPAVTRGALRAARDGIVRSVSVIVNLPESGDAAEAGRSVPGLELGLHLNVLVGAPVSDPASVASLLDLQGRFVGLGTLARRLALGSVQPTELAREVRAQVGRARALGIPALAWDSHRHVHLFPPAARVIAPLARELGARYVRRAALPSVRVGRLVAKRMVLALLTRASASRYRGVGGNDWYVDLSMWSPTPDAAAIAGLAVLEGSGEFGCHPGEIDTLLAERDSLVAPRERELALLCDPRLRSTFGDRVRWRVPDA